MPYRLADWRRLVARLNLARERTGRFRDAPEAEKDQERHLLDEAVIAIRDTAEYMINVHLELRNMRPERRHHASDRARELHALKLLDEDFSDTLERLERFRQRAQYGGYVRQPSIHYSSADVDRCLLVVERLVGATREALKAAGKDVE